MLRIIFHLNSCPFTPFTASHLPAVTALINRAHLWGEIFPKARMQLFLLPIPLNGNSFPIGTPQYEDFIDSNAQHSFYAATIFHHLPDTTEQGVISA
ncbi:hypothetical protein Ddc_12809 [Ditylenchus destructor]|nr:hypothetical protein Ddc_12809 [Ditylenchus destructor]